MEEERKEGRKEGDMAPPPPPPARWSIRSCRGLAAEIALALYITQLSLDRQKVRTTPDHIVRSYHRPTDTDYMLDVMNGWVNGIQGHLHITKDKIA